MKMIKVLEKLCSHPKGTFLNLEDFNNHAVGACSIEGVSPVWEMHPDTDELFYIIEGVFEVTLYEESGQTHHIAEENSLFVVPKGVWHKPAAPNGAQFIFFTPGQSIHSSADDPR